MMLRSIRFLKSWFPMTMVALLAGWIMVAQQPRRVDDALLKTGSKTGEEWISYGVNWSEQRYSPLKQIDASNVSRLGLAWSYDIPLAPGNPQTHQEGTPIVFNGVLYSITPWSIVYAVDLKTGKELWRADPEVNQQVWQSRICCGVVNRGIAMYEGKIIAPAVDGRLRALDAATGRVLWETRVSPETMPYTITMAPRVIKGGKIIIGVSGGEYGVRGFFSAYDVNTGKMAWRFYTVPGDPSKPFEHPELEAAAKTWTNDWWKIGGGAEVWNGMAYDADNDIVYVGTGQPGPWTDVHRGPGDNLYSCSIIAVRGATGKMVWYYQEVPGDDWDYDSIADLMLADLTINGRRRQVIMHAPKDAFFYVIDRVTGEVISADPITKVSWATGMDAKGHPIVNPAARYKTTPVNVNPGPSGGHVWPPWSYNPGTGLVYIPGTAGQGSNYTAAASFTPAPTEIGPTGRGQMNMGTALGGGQLGRGANQAKGAAPAGTPPPDNAEAAAVQAAQQAPAAAPKPEPLAQIGPDGPTGNVLYAWDPIARKERWRAAGAGAGPFSGGSLSTAGNLVFSSVNNKLLAFRADTGEKLLDLDLYMSQMGPPISFMIDGKQYISVAGGPPGGGAFGGGAGHGAAKAGDAPALPPQPAHLLLLTVDGKAPIPGAPAK
ncbi:MAG: PQQ-binding-like beta-propeller repeat protein [Acidobacteriia bacterium]|nr:PQQ-binding-like beta-propeller repeat protein [Terriglobia bacterium]